MPVKSVIENVQAEKILDDVSSEVETPSVAQLNVEKLAELRAKKAKQERQDNNMAAKIVSRKDRSLALGVVGLGHAGSKIAEAFYKVGYDAIVINLAQQDLKLIGLPDTNKLLLEYGIGGASKELSI